MKKVSGQTWRLFLFIRARPCTPGPDPAHRGQTLHNGARPCTPGPDPAHRGQTLTGENKFVIAAGIILIGIAAAADNVTCGAEEFYDQPCVVVLGIGVAVFQ